jgi:hypothetical protein
MSLFILLKAVKAKFNGFTADKSYKTFSRRDYRLKTPNFIKFQKAKKTQGCQQDWQALSRILKQKPQKERKAS